MRAGLASLVTVTWFTSLTYCSLLCAALGDKPQDAKPNIVLIMTDNHSPWTLGCYGNREIRTPHIDRLAREGTLLEHCYSSNAVCSPTRATYLTGLLPSQHGVHRYLSAGGAQMGSAAYSTIAEFRTLPESLRDAGYVCGLSGKWHLGLNTQPQEGFTFWVTNPHGGTREFYDQEVIEGGRTRTEATYLTDYWTDRGVEFIRDHRDRPFFLFLSYNGPYGLGSSLLNPPRNRHADYYRNHQLESFPRRKVHPWLFNNRNFINNPQAMRRYAAEISGVDDGVGRILATLEELKLDDNTLVIFTADQGLAGGQSGFWGMGDHTRPLTAYDWTMHVPLIFRYPGHVPQGVRSKIQVSNYDLLPTLLSYLNLSDQGPPPRTLPGRDFSDLLRGKPLKDWDDTTYFEFENVRAIRTPRWKYIERIHEEPNELYDLAADPGETKNLYSADEHQAVREELATRLHAFFERYADPQYDLWRGGKSKSGLMRAELFPGAANYRSNAAHANEPQAPPR